jgi:hypothetical protein
LVSSSRSIFNRLTNQLFISFKIGLKEYSSVYNSTQLLLRTAKDSLKEVYDDFTVYEWIEQNIYPYLLKMEDLMNKSMSLKEAKIWPQRPIKILEDLKRYN